MTSLTFLRSKTGQCFRYSLCILEMTNTTQIHVDSEESWKMLISSQVKDHLLILFLGFIAISLFIFLKVSSAAPFLWCTLQSLVTEVRPPTSPASVSLYNTLLCKTVIHHVCRSVCRSILEFTGSSCITFLV